MERDGLFWQQDPVHQFASREEFSALSRLERADGSTVAYEYDRYRPALAATDVELGRLLRHQAQPAELLAHDLLDLLRHLRTTDALAELFDLVVVAALAELLLAFDRFEPPNRALATGELMPEAPASKSGTSASADASDSVAPPDAWNPRWTSRRLT